MKNTQSGKKVQESSFEGIIGIAIVIIVSLFISYWFDVQYGYGEVMGLLVAIFFYLIIRDLIREVLK